MKVCHVIGINVADGGCFVAERGLRVLKGRTACDAAVVAPPRRIVNVCLKRPISGEVRFDTNEWSVQVPKDLFG